MELTHEKTESNISTGITEKVRRRKEALQSIVIGAGETKERSNKPSLRVGRIDIADTEITLLSKSM